MTRARRFPGGRSTSRGHVPDADGFDLPPASQAFGSPQGERVPGGWDAHDAGRVFADRALADRERRSSFSPQSEAAPEHRPLYARMLRLRHVAPSGFLCFVFLEGGIALGALLALAELVSWWGVLVLPMLVALMVKLNDVIAGSLARAAQPVRRPGEGLPAAVREPVFGIAPSSMDLADDATTRLPSVTDEGYGAPIERPRAERNDLHQQWLRQSATRRYE